MMIFMVLVCFLFIYGIFYMISDKGGSNINFNKGNNAEEILKEKYVNGEIDDATYERMIKTIKN